MQQLNLQGKTKEELAIEFIREHEPEEGYFVGDSGGKDSTYTLSLLRQRYNLRVLAVTFDNGFISPQ